MTDILKVEVRGGYYFAQVIRNKRSYNLIKGTEILQLLKEFKRYHNHNLPAFRSKKNIDVLLQYETPSAMPMIDKESLDLIVELHNETVRGINNPVLSKRLK